MKKEKKEKTGAPKKIGTKRHTCTMGPTIDPRYMKCYLCQRIDVKRV